MTERPLVVYEFLKSFGQNLPIYRNSAALTNKPEMVFLDSRPGIAETELRGE